MVEFWHKYLERCSEKTYICEILFFYLNILFLITYIYIGHKVNGRVEIKSLSIEKKNTIPKIIYIIENKLGIKSHSVIFMP